MKYHSFKTVPSTNDIARNFLNKNEKNHGCIIRADFQENGRGRQGNGWESEAGKNLLMSLIVEPKEIHPSQQFIINQIVSTVLCTFVQEIIHKNLSNEISQEQSYLNKTKIKWPNDIYVDDKKIAGILIENLLLGNQITTSIIGIGLNVNQENFQFAPNPTSLKLLTNKNLDIEVICKECSNRILSELDSLNQDLLSSKYTQLLYKIHQKQRFLIQNQEITATIEGVSAYGMLRLLFADHSLHEFELNSIKYLSS